MSKIVREFSSITRLIILIKLEVLLRNQNTLTAPGSRQTFSMALHSDPQLSLARNLHICWEHDFTLQSIRKFLPPQVCRWDHSSFISNLGGKQTKPTLIADGFISPKWISCMRSCYNWKRKVTVKLNQLPTHTPSLKPKRVNTIPRWSGGLTTSILAAMGFIFSLHNWDGMWVPWLAQGRKEIVMDGCLAGSNMATATFTLIHWAFLISAIKQRKKWGMFIQ